MQKTRAGKGSLFLLLACLLALTGTAFCSSEPGSSHKDKVPSKPSLTPKGPELILQPSRAQVLHAVASGATRFEWALQGEGKLSSGDGDTVLYTAPEHGGAIALVSVVAHNQEGASPQSSVLISTAAPPVVRLDTVGIPAGWMASGDTSSMIELSGSPAGRHTGADCIKARYIHRPKQTFAAVMWWPKACGLSGIRDAWSQVKACSCSVDVLKAGNLRSANRMTFWARGERGGEVIEFKVGDDKICPLPGSSSDPLTLTTDWKQYEVDISGLDMKKAVALFTWVATDLHNPNGATFYLDDIQFEGAR